MHSTGDDERSAEAREGRNKKSRIDATFNRSQGTSTREIEREKTLVWRLLCVAKTRLQTSQKPTVPLLPTLPQRIHVHLGRCVRVDLLRRVLERGAISNGPRVVVDELA